jgi:hypothetical protein
MVKERRKDGKKDQKANGKKIRKAQERPRKKIHLKVRVNKIQKKILMLLRKELKVRHLVKGLR